jgi:CPA2 family monovalent cation:H+ antiporter-2
MHNADLILTLSTGLIAALVLGYGTHRLGWSPIVGYLLAGVLLGPHTPGFVANRQLADQLAEIGVILLMFGVGLHFRAKDLMAVRTIAIVGAMGQGLAATLFTALACVALGWSWSAGLVFGLAISVASTVVVTRVLADNNELQSQTGKIAIGWLVVEDIRTVFVLVLLPVVVSSVSGGNANLTTPILIATAKLIAFVAITLLIGRKVVPWLLRTVAAANSRELFTLSVLAVALGIAVSSSHLFGVSMALGAFLAGMAVGQSDFSARAGAEALPMRDAFAVMFFLSIGMMLEPRQILAEPLLTLATLLIVLLGKPIATFAIVWSLGYGTRMALRLAIALGQIGEFSFLLAVLGRQLGVLPEAAINPLVTTAIVSIMLNPILYRAAGRLDRSRIAPETLPRSAAHRAVVVGYGPVGKTVTRLLGRYGIEPTIIEMNPETFRKLQASGERAVFGDANQQDVLVEAGIANAGSLIFSSSGSAAMTESIQKARDINPDIHILVRADYISQAPRLLKAGVNEVFADEGEVALTLITSILKRLGATPEQLSDERERARSEMSPVTQTSL